MFCVVILLRGDWHGIFRNTRNHIQNTMKHCFNVWSQTVFNNQVRSLYNAIRNKYTFIILKNTYYVSFLFYLHLWYVYSRICTHKNLCLFILNFWDTESMNKNIHNIDKQSLKIHVLQKLVLNYDTNSSKFIHVYNIHT